MVLVQVCGAPHHMQLHEWVGGCRCRSVRAGFDGPYSLAIIDKTELQQNADLGNIFVKVELSDK